MLQSAPPTRALYRLLVDEGRRRAELPKAHQTRGVVFARGSSRFISCLWCALMTERLGTGLHTERFADVIPVADSCPFSFTWCDRDLQKKTTGRALVAGSVSRETVRLRDRESEIAGGRVGRGPGRGGARARAHGAPRRELFSDSLHTGL